MVGSLCLGFELVTSLRRGRVMLSRVVMVMRRIVMMVVAELVVAMYLVYIQDSQ